MVLGSARNRDRFLIRAVSEGPDDQEAFSVRLGKLDRSAWKNKRTENRREEATGLSDGQSDAVGRDTHQSPGDVPSLSSRAACHQASGEGIGRSVELGGFRTD